MKYFSETLQNVLYSIYEKTHVDFFILCNLIKKQKEFTALVFFYTKYSKFQSVMLEHFVEHKALISEECYLA